MIDRDVENLRHLDVRGNVVHLRNFGARLAEAGVTVKRFARFEVGA